MQLAEPPGCIEDIMRRIPPFGSGWVLLAALAVPVIITICKPVAKKVAEGLRKLGDALDATSKEAGKRMAEAKVSVKEAPKPAAKPQAKAKPKAPTKKKAAAKPKAAAPKPAAKKKSPAKPKSAPKRSTTAKKPVAEPKSAAPEPAADVASQPEKTPEPPTASPTSTTGRRRPAPDIETG